MLAVYALGRTARAALGADDVALLRRLKLASRIAELTGRLLLFVPAAWSWVVGTSALAFHLSIEAQMNHSIMHGAFVGLPGADRFTPTAYETIAIPFQSKTWRDAHRIHHANPSLLGIDPDTIHPLFRMHTSQTWRPWHALNTWLGAIFVFECWAFDYDRFLKGAGLRDAADRGELAKFARYVVYQLVLFSMLAGSRWWEVLVAGLVAIVARNLVFSGLQTSSSVGHFISTEHCRSDARQKGDAWIRFQIETSKNFVLRGVMRIICGGLDRHIEHHLFPHLPPNRLHGLSPAVRELCSKHGVRYVEYPTFRASLADSLSYLASLARRAGT